MAESEDVQERFHLLEQLELKFPFWEYFRIHKGLPYAFLLDSALEARHLGSYSFAASVPFMVFRARRQGSDPRAGARIETIRLADWEGEPLSELDVRSYVADPLEDLRQLLEKFFIDSSEYRALPAPLLAGAVGYFGYEAGYFVESLPDLGRDDLGVPEVCFALFDVVMAHCHASGTSYLSVIGRGGDSRTAHARAERLRDRWLGRIRDFEASWRGTATEAQCSESVVEEQEVAAHFDEAAYCRAVQDCREHIFGGDIFEVCMTHRLECPFVGDSWDLYRQLRRVSPAPFACYLEFPEFQVVSSSPERFLRLGRDRVAESRPIKGTRPRGRSPEEDEKLRRELETSVKDRAENMMIVDLVRNDLGKVCKIGSVHVPEMMAIERYATVFQMVSTIRGELGDGLHALDLVRAAFPGGSMTGAPKIEAMKIIDRLEPVKRGIYSGSIGYFDFSGPLDLNIVIRTFLIKDGRCFFNVGGAVVADSDPLQEYRETMDKARALKTALALHGNRRRRDR